MDSFELIFHFFLRAIKCMDREYDVPDEESQAQVSEDGELPAPLVNNLVHCFFYF